MYICNMNSAYFVLIKYLKYHNFLNYFKGYLLKVVLTVLFYFYLILACACLVGIQRTTLGWMKSIVFLMYWYKGLLNFNPHQNISFFKKQLFYNFNLYVWNFLFPICSLHPVSRIKLRTFFLDYLSIDITYELAQGD